MFPPPSLQPIAPFWSPSPPPRPLSPLGLGGYHHGSYGDPPRQEIDKSIGRLTEFKRVVEQYDPLAMKWKTEEEKDEEASAPKEIDKISECCFVFRKKITPNGPNIPPTIITFLDIKSWYLREAGKKVVGTHAGISWGASVLQVSTNSFL